MREPKPELKLMIFSEKHRHRYIRFVSDADKSRIALKIFREREADGIYDDETMDKKHVKFYEEALKGDENAALTFINLRCKYEYEGYEIAHVEEI